MANQDDNKPQSGATLDTTSGSTGRMKSKLVTRIKSLRSWLTTIENQVNAGEIVTGISIHSMSEDSSGIVYDCGLYNGLIRINENQPNAALSQVADQNSTTNEQTSLR